MRRDPELAVTAHGIGVLMNALPLRRIVDLAVVTIVTMLLVWSLPVPAFGAVQANVQVPLAGGVISGDDNPCMDEDLVHVSGRLHIKISYTENDNRISGSAHFQPMGAKLEGVETGDEFVGTGMFKENFSSPVDDRGAATTTFVSNFRILGKGAAPNLLIHQVGHITINADGTVTAEVDRTSVECR